MLRKKLEENAYVVKMGIASVLALLKVYLASFVLRDTSFASLVSLYYIGNVLIVALPFGALLFMHSVLPAHVESCNQQSRDQVVGEFVTAALLGTTVLASIVLLAWKAIPVGQSHAPALLYAWAYAVSQIAIVRAKVFRNYDRYADLLILRGTVAFSAVMLALIARLDVVSLITLESCSLLLFSAFVLRGMPVRFSGVLRWIKKALAFAVPSVVGAVFGNLDRLIATATLADENLARFGVLYLLVAASGTLTQFVNTKFLPELFIARRANGDGGGISSIALRGFVRPFPHKILWIVVALSGLYAVCWFFAVVSPYNYSQWEILLVAAASIGRVADLIGSVGMADFGIGGICAIQFVVGASLVGLCWLAQPTSVGAALTITIGMYFGFGATTVMVRNRILRARSTG